jgi:hypothetical protein
MVRSILLGLCAVALTANLAFADPELAVTFHEGVPRVQIAGDYAHSTYTVLRSAGETGPYVAITERDILCLGACFAEDRSAVASVGYFYRFDVLRPDGSLVHYGPYPVTFPGSQLRTVHSRIFPNPGMGAGTVEFYIAGETTQSGLEARAALFDVQGRRVRELYRGTLPRGLTTVPWDGLDASGQRLRSGLYFLRFETSAGASVTRVIRSR